MLMGLVNTSSCFETCIELLCRGLQWKTLLIYLDYVIVYASSPEQTLARVDEVFTRLGEARLNLQPSKCQLFQRQVAFLGHAITEDGVSPDPEKVKAVQDWRQPKCFSGIRSFIGLCSYYRRYIRAFSTCARPLFQLLEAGQCFKWIAECKQAFLDMKNALLGDVVLAYPRDEGLYFVDVDAGSTGIRVHSSICSPQRRLAAGKKGRLHMQAKH